MTEVGDPPRPGPAIRRLTAGDITRDSVDAFLRGHSFPLMEGRNITFVWRGSASGVNLRHWVYGLPSSQPFTPLPHSDLWYVVIQLPESSRIEYKFEIVRGPSREWIRDPFNDEIARDPFGANSVCRTEGHEVPEWTREDPEARPGRLEETSFDSKALGGTRPLTLYYPARYRTTRRYPLLVAHDGSDYLNYSGVKIVLDNLIHRLEIAGMIVAFIESEQRLVEYADHEGHDHFVAEELVPHLERELPLEARPAGRGLMGASFGAVGCFSTALRYPGRFGRLLLQSGSFAFSDTGVHERGPAFDPVVEFVNRYRDDPIRVAERVYVSCGTYESLIYENRSLVPLLQAAGMDVRYEEARDGHNWENWRDRLRTGLSWLFPGPLWMVYE